MTCMRCAEVPVCSHYMPKYILSDKDSFNSLNMITILMYTLAMGEGGG